MADLAAKFSSQSLTLFDWISLIWVVPIVLLRIFGSFVWLYFAPHSTPNLHWKQKLANAITHTGASQLGPKHLYRAYMIQTTLVSIQKCCLDSGFAHKSIKVPMPKNLVDSTANPIPAPTLHLLSLDTDNNGPTLLFCHGGGYHFPINTMAHFPLALHMAQTCKASRLVFIECGLTPELQYPDQLAQLVESTTYLITSENVRPSQLIIAGDSAGGHLVVSLLAHLASPCSTVAPLSLAGERLKAAVLISPWLSMKPEAILHDNLQYDYICESTVGQFARFLNADAGKIHGDPVNAVDARSKWAAAFEKNGNWRVVDRLLITAGDREVLFESYVEFASRCLNAAPVVAGGEDDDQKVQVEEAGEVFAVGQNEVHAQPTLDASFGYFDGASMITIRQFLRSL